LEKIDDSTDTLEIKNTRSLNYDYLVIALGSETKKFFGMSDVQKYAFTIKNLNDAIILRNHIIYLLEQSDQLPTITMTTNQSIYRIGRSDTWACKNCKLTGNR
jgi:NADH dehydrogenase FAD-containing subunit